MTKKLPPRSDGMVDEGKFIKLWDKLYDQVNMEMGIDDDGDPRVEVKLVDRSRYERLPYVPVPYSHSDYSKRLTFEEDMALQQASFKEELLNLRMASDRVNTRLEIMAMMERRKKDGTY